MYRICVLLVFIAVSCQNFKPQDKPMVYKTLPQSEVVEVGNQQPVYEAKVIEERSIDLSAGNEEILDPVDTESAAANAKLKSQLQEQKLQIARLQQENMHLRDQKIAEKKTSAKQRKNTSERATKLAKNNKANSRKTSIKTTKNTSVSRDVSQEITKKNSVLEKDRDVILGEQAVVAQQKTIVETKVVAQEQVGEQEKAVVQESAVASQESIAQEKSVVQESAVTSQESIAQEKSVAQESAITSPKSVAQNNTATSQKVVAQERLVYKEEEESSVRQNVAYQLRKHCLRIISLPANQDKRVVEDIIAFLKQQNIEATYHTIQRYRVVDIVNTPAFGTAEAKAFQKRIHQLPYQGSLQFKDAYYTIRKY